MTLVLRRAFLGFFANDCPLAAAAIAYYLLLSIFPLILLILTIGSTFLPPAQLEHQLLEFLNQYATGSRATLRAVVHGFGENRTSFSLLALVGLAWSGMGIFGALRAALNQAWGVRETRSFWRQRRLEITFALLIGLLFLGSSVITWGIDELLVPSRHGVANTIYLVRLLIGSGVALVGFTLCYQLVPDSPGRSWRASLVAGTAATVMFEVAKWLFLGYITSFATFSLVYGAIGAVIVFLVWAYATASILLFGGQLAREIEALSPS